MKTNSNLKLYSLLLILFSFTTANAKEYSLKWSEMRMFVTDTTFASQSSSLNALLQPDAIPPMEKATGFGLEVTAEVLPWFKGGTKIKGIFAGSNKKESPFPATEYLAIAQYSAGLTARASLINTDHWLLDLYAELGLSNNTVEVKSTVGTGKWDKDALFYQRGGASLGFGNKEVKIYVEGGYENFKLDDLKHTGTIGQNITSLDLSGNYVGIGLIISGLPSWLKVGGVSVGN